MWRRDVIRVIEWCLAKSVLIDVEDVLSRSVVRSARLRRGHVTLVRTIRIVRSQSDLQSQYDCSSYRVKRTSERDE